ncbi:hypothetical protein SAMD00019534_032590 [Acytostelium subglobosum LB1]|uniref:hypothetical protein n=1 Tax=Acytostelium subglobosum LB1 TaxID=1410327 RepID=UPI000644A4AC|nr:hypothetical protein SAMD00019534_032590 [Acytostelium subglobosum LB1]GAM20084.1 hypothetical protein SAMD00019534_032590 [Acytostelium subglobosum LB1]|eukprot:XP_012756846.1 hypothetical protein SAMD00019534_032590 [Acytostelium subglobosum LB1]
MDVDGLKINIHPNVYSPFYFPESAWYSRQLLQLVKPGDRFLEVGIGSGITTVYMSRAGAKTTGVDINPDAVETTKLNLSQNNLSGLVLESDVFNALPEGSKFEWIYWNHPWQNNPNVIKELQTEKTLDPGYQLLSRYIKESERYLSETGRIVIGTSNCSNLQEVNSLAQNLGYSTKRLLRGSEELADNVMEKYYIMEFIKNKKEESGNMSV